MNSDSAESWYHHHFYEYKTLSANIVLARGMVESALARKESRGHIRESIIVKKMIHNSRNLRMQYF